MPTIKCFMCPKPADLSGFRQGQYERTGRAYCSRECSTAYRARRSSETATKTNLKYASARMKLNNPMRHKKSRDKMRKTLLRIGHRPSVQGGNGTPPPPAEAALFAIFGGMGFVMQFAIRTGKRKGDGKKIPHSYKVDLANPTLRLAIEADGGSHGMRERKEQDRKKEGVLGGLGWTVLRFTNLEILNDPTAVVVRVLSTISKLKTSTLMSLAGS